jgi:hypothetical protein
MARVILGVAALALTVYALVDCAQTDQARVRNLPKAGWIAVILFVLVAGPVAWFLGGRPRSRPPRKGGGSGPRGPEDDPDFLRNL